MGEMDWRRAEVEGGGSITRVAMIMMKRHLVAMTMDETAVMMIH